MARFYYKAPETDTMPILLWLTILAACIIAAAITGYLCHTGYLPATNCRLEAI